MVKMGFKSGMMALMTGASLLVSGCSGGEDEKAEGPVFKTEFVAPDYYPEDYGDMIKKGEKEGSILIYSNVAEYNWRYIVQGFEALHPSIKIKVETMDIGPAEAFERYYSETSAGKSSADIIAVAAPDAWQRFINADEVADYTSAEAGQVQDWSKPSPGVYTLATDPMILIYNKMLLKPDEYPTTVSGLADEAEKDPAKWKNKITTYDAGSHPFAYSLHWEAVHEKGWSYLDRLAPYTRPESGGATMLDKVMGGEYLAAFYTSGITVFPRMKDTGRDKILGWKVPQDGVPVMMRGIAVTKQSTRPNAARLFLDYMISHDGQVMAGKGGMTPYRPDVKADEVPFFTYSQLAEAAGGDDKMMIIGYNPELLSGYDDFMVHWNALFQAGK